VYKYYSFSAPLVQIQFSRYWRLSIIELRILTIFIQIAKDFIFGEKTSRMGRLTQPA
jgi:hypothetical protein